MKSTRCLASCMPVLSSLLLACEEKGGVVAPELHLLASAGAMTSMVTDPEGDIFVAERRAKVARQAYQDIVSAEISKDGGTFVFTMEMAGSIPETPELAPPGVTLLEWRWNLITDPTASRKGFPYAPGQSAFAAYMVQILWDGLGFVAQLIDRTPLLAGGDAIVTPIAFSIEGTELKAEVSTESLGNPSSFRWVAGTVEWPTLLGTAAHLGLDWAPSIDAGEPLAIWPQ
jgi:hypothetical protein